MPIESRVTLVELDVDNSKVIKKQADLLRQIEQLKKSNKDLKKDTDGLTNATNEQAESYTKTQAEIKKLQQDSRTYTKILQDQSRAGQTNIRTIEKTDGSINSLRNALNVNKTAYKTLTKEQRENESIGGKLLKTISQQDEEYKELSRSIGNNQVDVGNYKLAVEDLAGNINIFGVNVGQVIGNLKSKQASLKGVTGGLKGASSGARLFGKALLATGIGAIVALIGTLVSAFASTQKGIDSIKRALAPLKGAFDGVFSVAQKLAVNIFGQLADRFTITKNVILAGILLIRIGFNKLTGDTEEAESLGQELKNVINESVEASERLNKKTKEFGKIWNNAGKEISEASKRQRQIVELGIKAEELAISNVKAQGELSREIKAQNKIAEDTTKPLAEREKATIASIEASKQLLKSEQELLGVKIKQLKLEQQQTDTTREDLLKLAELEKEFNDKETASLELQTTQTNKLNTIRREAEAKRKRAQEERVKRLEKELQLAQDLADKNLTIAQQELDLYIANNETRINEGEKLNRELINQETERLKAVLFSQGALNQQELENKRQQLLDELKLKNITNEQANKELEIAQNEFRLKQLALEKEFNKSKLDLEKQYTKQVDKENEVREQKENELRDKRATARLLELQNEIESLKLQGASKLELLNAQLNLEKEQAIIKAKELGIAQEKVDEEFAERRKRLERSVQEEKFNLTSKALGDVASLFQNQTELYQTFAIAQASIDTYLAANKALATLPPPFSFIQAGIATATGLANVAKIAGFAEGSSDVQPIGGQYQVANLTNTTGIITGSPNIRRSNGDNMLATVKTGEAILNTKQQGKINSLLGFDAIKYAVNGYADGTTFTSPTVTNNINRNIINNSNVNTGFSENSVNLVVDVKDIVKGTNEYNTQVKDATI